MFDKSVKLADFDPELAAAVAHEEVRQEQHIELIASENYTSHHVMALQGSVLTNKYAEGYPGKRYYGGCEYVDVVEQLAIDRAKELLMPTMPMFSPIPVLRLTRRFLWRCWNRVTLSWA